MAFQRSEIILIIVILLFFSLSLIFLISLVIGRLTKIRGLKSKLIYDAVGNKLLFLVLFENKSFKDIKSEKEFTSIIGKKKFRLFLLDSIIKLHRNYTGLYQKQLETFYIESNIIDETYKKLKSRKWSAKCEAIRELAEMNIEKSYSLINNYVSAKNLILRQEAIMAVVKLEGVDGLIFLCEYNDVLSDWMQLNLISIIKNNFPITEIPYYLTFINSTNKSVALFGRRLRAYYEQNNESFSEIKTSLPEIQNETVKNNLSIKKQVRIASFFKKKWSSIVLSTLSKNTVFALVLLSCFIGTHLLEIVVNNISFAPGVIYYSFLNDIYYALLIAIMIFPISIALRLLKKKAMRFGTAIIYFSFIIIHLCLSIYFFKAKVPLGGDLFSYSPEDVLITTKASGGLSYLLIVVFILSIVLFSFLAYYINKSSFIFFKNAKLFALVVLVVFLSSYLLKKDKVGTCDDYENYVVSNKSLFFFENIFVKYSTDSEDSFSYDKPYYLNSESGSTEKLIDRDFPFLKKNSKNNMLAPFFNKLSNGNKPNFVFIILEGVGRDFAGVNAKLGSFTPFLDSLSAKGLFWENALSTGGRTFAALPSIFGSLPFLKDGYLEEGINAPKANSFFKILNCNGYSSHYYCGTESTFDKMDIFLRIHNVEIGLNQNKFGKEYSKLPGYNGFSWGYGDKELFSSFLKMPKSSRPAISVFFTIANHTPYLIPDQNEYIEKAKKRIQKSAIATDKKKFLSPYLNELSCVMYTDDALKYFFNEYAKLSVFANTIFIITGDHRAPEIPISFQIDRFRVPLIIYSPLLKRAATFKSVVTHFDITPSLLALLGNTIEQSSVNSWIGTLLDTSSYFNCNRQVGLMRNKNELLDFISKDYFLSGNDLYKMTDNLGIETITDDVKRSEIKKQFEIFKQKNKIVFSTNKLIPDSVLHCKTFNSNINKTIVKESESVHNSTILKLKNSASVEKKVTHSIKIKQNPESVPVKIKSEKKLSKKISIIETIHIKPDSSIIKVRDVLEKRLIDLKPLLFKKDTVIEK